MRDYMSGEQEKRLARVRFLVAELAATEFQESPCPLLMGQLNEAEVLCERLELAIIEAREAFEGDSK